MARSSFVYRRSFTIPTWEAEMAKIRQQLNADIPGIAQNVRHSLVQIKNGRRRGSAGTIWHPEWLILTNTHVARRRSSQVSLQNEYSS